MILSIHISLKSSIATLLYTASLGSSGVSVYKSSVATCSSGFKRKAVVPFQKNVKKATLFLLCTNTSNIVGFTS